MELTPTIRTILETLRNGGHEAYVVGGCVRDVLLGRTPIDWDVTTDAVPERIQELFPDSFYENAFGTVTVKTDDNDPRLREVQVTPFRTEGRYSDKRHPDVVRFAVTLEEDLSRRDFTINAMAMDVDGVVVDHFNGRHDLERGIIRAVGNAEERFAEDALRMLRVVRFATTLGFTIETRTLDAILHNRGWLKDISQERIRDEFEKIIDADAAHEGIELLRTTGLLEFIVPELLEGVGMEQNLHHIYSVWEHNVRALKYAADKRYSFPVRLASLLHDVGKPRTKRGEGRRCTFYGHDVVGARMTRGIMERLRFPKDLIDQVVKLVRFHLFYYNVGEVTESSVRRLLANVGPEYMEDLIKVREADRIGSGTPKAVPYKIRHLKYIIDKVSHDPVSVKMLAIRGEDVMRELGIPPGPKIGLILSTLLAEVLDEPERNDKKHLLERVKELNAKTPEELKKSLRRIEQALEEEEKERMKKYYV